MSTSLTKAGRYEIQGELGRGAMGVVYRALDPVIGRSVAVKTLKLSQEGTGLTHPELLARFQTEARAAGLLTHPNIVVVYDAGEEDGLYYITMELVEGKSMQALLDAGQGFPLPRVLRIMEQACSALQFAHERNIVHRDIKPANLMLTADDTVKVTDFGTAKILQFGTVQQTAHVMGTPSYMSPEQVKGKVVDGRSDIFSLGVMLYEMVTGEKPFPGQNITTVIYKIVNEEPVPPRQIDSSIHPGLSAVVMKALAKEPDSRYQNCRELMEDLKNYRAIVPAAGSPHSTMALSANPESTVVMAPGRAKPAEDTSAAARSLNARAASPMHTPAVRRTGPIAPLAEPKRKSPVVSVFVALLLITVIYFGAKQIRPVFEAAREQNQEHKEADSSGIAASKTPGASPDTAASAANEAVATAQPPVIEKPAVPKNSEASARPPEAKKSNTSLTPAAAEYKGRVEEAAALHGLSGKLKIRGAGNTLTLSGKLLSSEHSELLKFLKSAPAGVQIVDDIGYEAPPTAARPSIPSSGRPLPTPGRGAIYVVANVAGATAVIPATGGEPAKQCETPCGLSGLFPGQYNLEVRKAGFQPMQTALQVRSGQVLDEKVTLEPTSVGLYVSSKPEGADVFINGAKQSGQTPVSLPLAPGQYDIVLRLPGHEAYSSKVAVTAGAQSQLDVELKPRNSHVAWAQVKSIPKGAEIFVDGITTGQTTPARVEIPAGIHTIELKLNGFQLARRSIQATEGGTVMVGAELQRQ
ncbi:MAG TPA: PEGA domain-containing protein [Terriglobales bacterium]|nr:PEGA domain-containing protein [Terriglobales bacterium]